MKYHTNATTNIHIRELIRDSDDSIRDLAEKFKINPKTVVKWRDRESPQDHSNRPLTIQYSLTREEKRIIAIVRKHLKNPLDDIVDLLQPHIPQINRSNCYRVLVEYRLNHLPKELQGKGKFGQYLPGFIHLDTIYLPKLVGYSKRRYAYTAIDRVTKIAFVWMVEKRSKDNSVKFLRMLIDFFPYPIHRILTDNGIEFTYRCLSPNKRPRYKNGKERPHPFTLACKRNKIKHKMTKFRHPWTNGQVERLNRRIKDQTIFKIRYPSYEALEEDLAHWQDQYNLKTKLKSIKKLTPYEKVVEYFKERPESFSRKPKKSQFCTTNW
jgi:transposase InsO family protein